jgi:hypothetical protein
MVVARNICHTEKRLGIAAALGSLQSALEIKKVSAY